MSHCAGGLKTNHNKKIGKLKGNSTHNNNNRNNYYYNNTLNIRGLASNNKNNDMENIIMTYKKNNIIKNETLNIVTNKGLLCLNREGDHQVRFETPLDININRKYVEKNNNTSHGILNMYNMYNMYIFFILLL